MGGLYLLFSDFEEALKTTKPDIICISTYPHILIPSFAIRALKEGCHVFLEKPLADTVAGAERLAEVARKIGKKLVVGYILRHYPSWEHFVELSQELGKLW